MIPPRPSAQQRINWFKTLRVAALLLILLLVALSTLQDRYRSTRWRVPLFVAIYPIAADSSPATRRYMESLDGGSFRPIDLFFTREAGRYRLRTEEPIRSRLQPALADRPPQRSLSAGTISTALWSLKLRFWAWRASRGSHEPQDVRIFVLYHDPALTETVPHSLGLTQGLIGVVYAFADAGMSAENNVVIAHELMHTVGATDKYDALNDAPHFPEGFGDPLQNPLYPQKAAELMAGRRMLSSNRWEQVSSLDEVVVGTATAREIRWPQHAE